MYNEQLRKSFAVKKKWLRLFILFLIIFSLQIYGKTISAQASSVGTVTATSLNFRSAASTSSTIIGKLPQGTSVIILSSQSDSSGVLWYKITAPVNGSSKTGYVVARYIKKTASITSTGSTYVRKYAKIRVSSVSVRSSYTSTSSVVVKLTKSTTVKVLGYTKVGTVKWYKIYYKNSSTGISYRGYVKSDTLSFYKIRLTGYEYKLNVATKSTNIYKTANLYDKKLAQVSIGQELVCLGTITSYNHTYTKVRAKVDGDIVYGYVLTAKLKYVTSTVSSSTSIKAQTTANVNLRKIATTVAKSYGVITDGSSVKILGSITVLGTKWYKCSYTTSTGTRTGYIAAKYVEEVDDSAFESTLSSFPSSYRTALTALHEKYPNWTFVAVDTGLSWSTVIANETTVGRNTISSTVPSGGSSGTYSAPFSYLSTATGCYSWATDTYTLYDGSTWYTADEDVVEYYMDPRNFLTTTGIFQFETLAYTSTQTTSVIESILDGTFMEGNYSYKVNGTTYTRNYAESFLRAGERSGASAYYLAALSRQEIGTTKTGSVTGTYSGYEGYYNYYNIGANDSATGGAIASGLSYASSGTTYIRPWSSPYKAIVGGAEFIATSYINKGQNTSYLKKFSVANSSYYYWHQYCTNVQAPLSLSKKTYSSYSSYGVLDDNLTFYIPVYDNMPSSACSLPANEGNPNNYLKTLKVKNTSTGATLSFSESFTYNDTGYSMVVASGVNKITVSASAVSDYATGISGNTTYDISSLGAGETKTITVKCTAGNGDVRSYKIVVKRAS